MSNVFVSCQFHSKCERYMPIVGPCMSSYMHATISVNLESSKS